MIELLLVEDDAGDAALLRQAVRDAAEPHLIHHVERLDAAVDALDGRRFDVAVVDLHLPDSHGIATLHRILEFVDDAPVIVLTGMEDASLGVAATDAGAQDYIVKGSLGPAATLRAIHQAMRRQRTRSDLRERVKELTALYAVSRALQRDPDPAEVAEEVVEHLLMGLERPSESWAYVAIDGDEADRNRPSTHVEPAIERTILVGGIRRGRIAIGSLVSAPFLAEEEELVAAIAESLGVWLERRDAVDGLRRAEQQVRLTLGQLPIALTTIDRDLTISSAAGGAFDILGIEPREMIGPIADHGPTPEWVEAARCALAGRSVDIETAWRGRRLRNHFEPVLDADGEVESAACISLDVTEERERDAELVEQRERLHALFDHALDAIFLVGDGGRILEANPAAADLTGRDREELLSMYDWQLTETPDPDRGRRAWETLIEAGERTGEWRIARTDGSVVETEYRAVVDIVPGVHLSVVRDVTRRKEAEAALRVSEERYRSLAEEMRDGVYRVLFFPEERLEYVNPAIERITGFPPSDFYEDRGLFSSRVHPEDAHLELDLDALGDGDLDDDEQTVVLRFRHRDGQWIWLELRRSSIREDGHLVGIQGFIHDVTERVVAQDALAASEERFRALAEDLRDVVYRIRLEPERRLEYVNPAIERVTGFPPAAYHADEHLFRSCVHDEDLPRVGLDAVATEGVHTVVIRFRHAEGHWIRLEVRRAGQFEAGRLVGIQGIIYDVTERERLAAERERAADALRTALDKERRALEDLRAVESLKASFLQSVSHELRTPLTSVLGSSRLLAQRAGDIEPEKIHTLHQGLLRNAERLQDLLKDLMDVERFGRAVVQLETEEADLVRLARSVVAETDLDGHPCDVHGDEVVANVDTDKVRRVLENLLGNAVRHTPAGTAIEVRVEVERDGIHLEVADEGPGVSPELHSAIFEPFRQGPNAVDDPSPGTGLGLAIVDRLARLCGGRAWVEDRPGGGARFRVQLPYQDVGRHLVRTTGQ